MQRKTSLCSLLLIIFGIMINKIKEQREPSKSRIAVSRNLNSKSKITQLLVHRMIQRIKTQDNIDNSSSFAIHNVATDTSNYQSQQQRKFISIKKQATKTQESHPRVDSIFREVKSRSRWEDGSKQPDNNFDNWKEYRARNYKVVTSGKSSDFNVFITERMRKVQKKREKEQKNSKQSMDSVYFGLNVVQIKKMDIFNKEMKQKDKNFIDLKSKIASRSKEQDSSSPTNSPSQQFKGKRAKSKDFTSLSPLKIGEDQEETTQVQYFIFKDKDERRKRPMTKTVEGNSYNKKMKKMLECLDVVLNSYHCRLSVSQDQNTINSSFCEVSLLDNNSRALKNREKTKYSYFIGAGNNSNLIRSLFRKRSWWVEVQQIAKANFVWTQIKIANVLQRIGVHSEEDWTSEIIFYEEINEEVTPSRNSAKKSISTLKSDIKRVKDSSLSQVFHSKQSKRYHQVLVPKESEARLESIEPPQLFHNHYSHNYMFGNKNALYYNLSKYYEFTRKTLSDIIPLTFYLQKGNNRSMNQFERVFNQTKKKQAVWILKPAENSNRGNGIEVTDALHEIRLKINNQKKLIVQYYLKNLLLYNYRKFDIRTYMIAVTFNGRTKFFWYEEGYIRTASETYDLQNLRDQFIHLTNDAIQKKGDNYGRYEQGNKLSYSEFQRYLQAKFPKETWKVSDLHQKMKEIATDSVKATYCRLDPGKKDFSFQLFGLDFMVDSQFKPYLIQINTNPCLQLSSPVLERLIPRMMENMFRISIDPIFRPNPDFFYSKSELYYMYDLSFLDRNRFSLIFDEKYDRNFQWEERCRSMRGIEWSLNEEEEYADDGKIIVVDY